jgi:hypothetical protein
MPLSPVSHKCLSYAYGGHAWEAGLLGGFRRGRPDPA